MNASKPSLDIVIVNWNAGDLLRECVETITQVEIEGFELGSVVVVDNASRDGSTDAIGRNHLPMSVLRNGSNLGFATACNQGARLGAADHVLFLNPDTRLFASSLTLPMRFMALPEHQGIGICGVQLMDKNGHIARSCARFPSLAGYLWELTGLDRISPTRFRGHFMREWTHQDSREVDQIMGAFFLIRRALFESLGGFDERFFVYFEEVDLSYRARKKGYASYYLAETRVFHKGCGTSERVKAKRLFYSLRSRILYAYKHFGAPKASALLVLTLLPEAMARIVLAACRRSRSQIRETIGAYGLLWRDLPRMLRRNRP